MSHPKVISKEKFKEIIDSSLDKVQFQKFIELVAHAQTCNKCKFHYNKALSIAESHMHEVLR